jgi:hypothetical protein
MITPIPMPAPAPTLPARPLALSRNAHGRLMLAGAPGEPAREVRPVRAFPLSAPEEGVSLVGEDGHECAWIPGLDQLDDDTRVLVEAMLAEHEFMPRILAIRSVSTFSTPSTWEVDTDRGPTRLVLKGEEDIRRLAGPALLVTDGQGLSYRIADRGALDRASKRLLERFL